MNVPLRINKYIGNHVMFAASAAVKDETQVHVTVEIRLVVERYRPIDVFSFMDKYLTREIWHNDF